MSDIETEVNKMYATCADNCNYEESDFYDALEARLMQMTYFAHKEVLFEKIKQKIQEQEGAKLDRIVDLLIESSKNNSEIERQSEQRSEELQNALREVFD